jgi:hypothetical protein
MALWMKVDFRTALPVDGNEDALQLQKYQLKFKLTTKDLHDTRHETWKARVQEVLHQWEGRPENWPVMVLGTEIIEQEDEEQ